MTVRTMFAVDVSVPTRKRTRTHRFDQLDDLDHALLLPAPDVGRRLAAPTLIVGGGPSFA